MEFYSAACQQKDSPLSPLPIQYADFAHWQQKSLSLEKHLAYWKKQIGENPSSVLELPTDFLRPKTQSFRGAGYSFTLPGELKDKLEKINQQENSTLFMSLLAVFQVLLYRYSGQEDIITGSPIANRNREEIESLIGFFVNTLVLRNNLSGTPHFRELLRRVRKVTMEAYEHQDLPFEKLVEELKPERDMSRNSFFQVMFVLQNAPLPKMEHMGLTLSPVWGDSRKYSASFKWDYCHVVLSTGFPFCL